MSLQTVAREFVDLCNLGKNIEVMRTMYAPDIVSVEREGSQTIGRSAVIRKSELWHSDNTVHAERARGPYFNGPRQFAVHFAFDITRGSTGEGETIEEVGVYTVNEDDKITREQFFYDGEH